MNLLEIRGLSASVDGNDILKGIDLTIAAGEVHAVMGPNGSGKSTLAYVLAGRDGYAVTAGDVRYDGRDLLAMAPEERAREGVFLAFQYPVEIPGVTGISFLKAAINALRTHRGEGEWDALQFLRVAKAKARELGVDEGMLGRAVNAGFSGGEKKRFEMLQMALLDPRLMILDETDSGLDIDALKAVASGIAARRAPHRAMLVITHYQRILEHIRPDYVHILAGGRIVQSGDGELAKELERTGYAAYTGQAA